MPVGGTAAGNGNGNGRVVRSSLLGRTVTIVVKTAIIQHALVSSHRIRCDDCLTIIDGTLVVTRSTKLRRSLGMIQRDQQSKHRESVLTGEPRSRNMERDQPSSICSICIPCIFLPSWRCMHIISPRGIMLPPPPPTCATESVHGHVQALRVSRGEHAHASG